MKYSRWQDAMIAQTKLLQFTESETGIFFLNGMGDSMNAQHVPGDQMPHGWLLGQQRVLLRQAEPVYVGGNVAEIIDHARDAFIPEAVSITTAFTPHGFALLPRPITIREADRYGDNAVIPVRAIAWITIYDEDNPDVGCYWVSYYTDIDDDIEFKRAATYKDPESDAVMVDTPEAVDYFRRFAPLSLVHSFQISFGDKAWEGDTFERCCRKCGHIAENFHSNDCEYRKSGRVVEQWQVETILSDDAAMRGLEQVRLVQVFWRIASQVFRGPERAPRGVWKDANRKGIEHKDVTVIRLRQYRDPHEIEPAGHELTCQFIVRGHWHTYHTLDGPIQKWVMPYVKGPDGAPFKMTKRVWELVR